MDPRCSCEQGTPRAAAPCRQSFQMHLGWWSHPLTLLCHSCLLRASGTIQPCVWEENKEKKNNKNKGGKRKEIKNYKQQQTTTTTKIYSFLLKLFFQSQQRLLCRAHISEFTAAQKNPKKLMNYLSQLRSILQRAVSEESKPQQGRQVREQLPKSLGSRAAPHCPIPVPLRSHKSPFLSSFHHPAIIDAKVTLFLGRLLPFSPKPEHFSQHNPRVLYPQLCLPQGTPSLELIL